MWWSVWNACGPWNVVSVTRRSSGVAPRACVRVYARVLVPPNLYIYLDAAESSWADDDDKFTPTKHLTPPLLHHSSRKGG